MKKILLFLYFLLMSIGIFGTDTQLYFEGWETHHTLSVTNNYSADPKTYGDFSFVYADAAGTGSPLTGSYHAILRHGKKCGQRTCSLTSVALLNDSYEIHTIKWTCKRGVRGQNLKVYYSTNGTTWTEGYNAELPSSKTESSISSLSITGPIYLKFEVSYNNAANSNYDANIDDITIEGIEIDIPSYTITEQSNNTDYGTVSLSGNVITGSPNSGYRYASPAYSVSPTNSATVTQNGNEFTVTPSKNTTITINFEAIPSHTLSSVVTPVGGGTITLGSENVLEGETTTASATPATGYTFTSWSISGTGATLSSTTINPTTITMGTDNATITATFIETPAPQIQEKILYSMKLLVIIQILLEIGMIHIQ